MADLSPCVLCLQLVGGRERRWHQHRAPRLSTSSGSSWDYLQFPSPRAHPFTLISGALGGGFRPTCLHSTSPGSCQEKEARAHCGWPQAWRGGAGEQGGEWASGGPDTSPPPQQAAPPPCPQRLHRLSRGREDGKCPSPPGLSPCLCLVSPQPVLPGCPTSGNSWDTLPSGGSLAPKPRAGNILSLS